MDETKAKFIVRSANESAREIDRLQTQCRAANTLMSALRKLQREFMGLSKNRALANLGAALERYQHAIDAPRILDTIFGTGGGKFSLGLTGGIAAKPSPVALAHSCYYPNPRILALQYVPCVPPEQLVINASLRSWCLDNMMRPFKNKPARSFETWLREQDEHIKAAASGEPLGTCTIHYAFEHRKNAYCWNFIPKEK